MFIGTLEGMLGSTESRQVKTKQSLYRAVSQWDGGMVDTDPGMIVQV